MSRMNQEFLSSTEAPVRNRVYFNIRVNTNPAGRPCGAEISIPNPTEPEQESQLVDKFRFSRFPAETL